jgi:hypothetical protein
MWLKRNNKPNALFFWKQAEVFAKASEGLPNTASPLTKYYSAMNAAKALLEAKGIAYSPYHGVTGANQTGKATLADETITLVDKKQIVPELCRYLGEMVTRKTYSFENVLYNLPFIHRAFTITFPTKPELFVPISKPRFVRIIGTVRSYFACNIVDRLYQNAAVIARLPGYEQDAGIADAYVVRRKARFSWDDTLPVQDNIATFKKYHQRIRRIALYIKGASRLWYLKMTGPAPAWINRSGITLTIMALHKLSELVRYWPNRLVDHFDSQHNWLLSEFINSALPQFIDEVSAEITGHEFMPPGYSPRA